MTPGASNDWRGFTVCFVARSDFVTKPGGDTVQWHLYSAALAAVGATSITWFGSERRPEANVYHALNVDRPLEIYPKMRAVKRAGRPFVLSSIHHPNAWMEEMRAKERCGSPFEQFFYRTPFGRKVPRGESIKDVVRVLQQRKLPRLFDAYPAWSVRARWLLEHAAGLLVLTPAEEQWVRADFQAQLPRAWVVPNWVAGIDPVDVNEPADAGERPVLIVGRIETRKNSLRLAQAAAEVGRPTLFLGRANPNERDYVGEFTRTVEASAHVRWIPGVPRDQLARHYRHASHLLNGSYAEVSPMVDIEALAFGCPVVTTERALHHELLPVGTPRCDPYSDDSLAAQLRLRPAPSPPTLVIDAEQAKARLLDAYIQANTP